MKIAIAATGLALAAMAAPAAAQNIVSNPGFESGLTGWTINPNNQWSIYSDAIAGTQSAGTGCVGAGCIRNNAGAFDTVNGSYIYQDLATSVGATYSLSFLFRSAGDAMELVALFGGTTAFDQTGLPTTANTYTVTGLVATSATTRLEFFGRQDPGFDRLDSVTVVQTAAGSVPEPAAWALMIVGFGAVGATLRRRSARIAFAA